MENRRWYTKTIKLLVLFALMLSLIVVTTSITGADSGGPDGYGYTFKDSDESWGPTYSWVDITGTGTVGPTGDDSYVTVPIGFDFSLYGNTYDEIIVSSNGYLYFSDVEYDWGSDWQNVCIPNSGFPDLFIAPWWDDLDTTIGGIYYETRGSSPNRQFIVEWSNANNWQWLYDPSAITFEAILYEGSNEILFQYQDVTFDFMLLEADFGREATVGIENADGTDGLQYSCNNAALTDGLAILFTYHEEEIAAEFSATPTLGFTPLAVQFTDETAGEYSDWTWEFGDGGTSTLQNPTHTYETPGPFTVNLTATGPLGRAVATKVDYIHPYTQGVGGQAYPVDKAGIVLLWVVLGMGIVAASLIVLRRRLAQN